MTNAHPLPRLTDSEIQSDASGEAGFGALTTEHGCLPLEALSVRASLCGLTADATIQQTFVNSRSELIEATYIFPLPDRAAVTSFRLEVAGRTVEGLLKERSAARQEYDDAVRAGHRAAIAEENRPDVFSLRVGNLPPGEKAVVTLTLVMPLEYADGQATYRFPLVVAPRYIPGGPLDGTSVGPGTVGDTNLVPDASCITPPVLLPGFPSPVRLSLEVDIDPAGFKITGLKSSLHSVSESAGDRGRRRIRLHSGERLDRDFVLRFHVAETQIKPAVVIAPDVGGSGGTYLLTLLPPATAPAESRERDVVLLLDRSGSMQGWKIVAARRAAARIVDSLTPADRLAVLAFDSEVEAPDIQDDDKLLPATDRNRFRAVEFLARMEARGGTELAEPLQRAVAALAAGDPSRDRVLVLVTDGQVGNEDHLLETIAREAREFRIFTLGIDRAVNAGFLRRLATLGGGNCDLVESEERLDEVMEAIQRRISPPALTGVRVSSSDTALDPASTTPARLPDLHQGVPVVVMGRYVGNAPREFLVEATAAGGEKWSAKVSAHVTTSRAISALWARGNIRDLEDRYACGGRDVASLEKQIVETSLRHQVLSRFTAFVAVDRAATVGGEKTLHQIVQPVELPQGWEQLPTSDRYEVACRAAAGASFAAERRAPVSDDGDDLMRLIPRPGAVSSPLREIEASSPPGPQTGLTEFRKWVANWLAEMARLPADDVPGYRTFLTDLRFRLAELTTDLACIGASAQLRPLVELMDHLNDVAAGAPLTDERIKELWSEAQQTISTFVGVAAPAAFWKKRVVT
jgi:Ca-activated chloride channel family protein